MKISREKLETAIARHVQAQIDLSELGELPPVYQEEITDNAEQIKSALITILDAIFPPVSKKVKTPPFTCKYCGRPSHIDSSDQTPPLAYCHPSDHGTLE